MIDSGMESDKAKVDKEMKMSKAFWEGFREGCMKSIWVGIVFGLGIALGNYVHPYETCKRMYDTQEDP